MKKGKKTKSPLKGKPLRNPGQSLDEQLQRILDDKATLWAAIVVTPIVLAGYEWYRWLNQMPYQPIPLTILAVTALIVGIWKLTKIRKEVQNLKLGRDGEKVVGQYLDRLREKGYRVFHDIQGENFNIDHVLIGPTGIYSLETKTLSKPTDRNAKIVFDGEKITKDGFEFDRDPIVQANAQARWLSNLLTESTGRRNGVKPVVLFPGWYVEPRKWQTDIWVIEPKSLDSFLGNEEFTLTKEDVSLYSYHLSRHIRSVR